MSQSISYFHLVFLPWQSLGVRVIFFLSTLFWIAVYVLGKEFIQTQRPDLPELTLEQKWEQMMMMERDSKRKKKKKEEEEDNDDETEEEVKRYDTLEMNRKEARRANKLEKLTNNLMSLIHSTVTSSASLMLLLYHDFPPLWQGLSEWDPKLSQNHNHSDHSSFPELNVVIINLFQMTVIWSCSYLFCDILLCLIPEMIRSWYIHPYCDYQFDHGYRALTLLVHHLVFYATEFPVCRFDAISIETDDWRYIDYQRSYLHYTFFIIGGGTYIIEFSTIFLNLRELSLNFRYPRLYEFSGRMIIVIYPLLRIPWVMFLLRLLYTARWYAAHFISPMLICIAVFGYLFVMAMSGFYSMQLLQMGRGLYILDKPTNQPNSHPIKKQS